MTVPNLEGLPLLLRESLARCLAVGRRSYVAWVPGHSLCVLRHKDAAGVAEWKSRTWQNLPGLLRITDVTDELPKPSRPLLVVDGTTAGGMSTNRQGCGAGAWKRACVRTGLAVKDAATKKVKLLRIVHDLRRSAARDFRRASITEGVIMDLCGWRTRAIRAAEQATDDAI
jgi:hypothetical protein